MVWKRVEDIIIEVKGRQRNGHSLVGCAATVQRIASSHLDL